MPQAVKCRADIQVSCFTHEGIDAVKEALLKGLENDKEEMPIKVSLKLGSMSLVGAIGRYCGPIGPWRCPAPSNILHSAGSIPNFHSIPDTMIYFRY